MTFRSRPLLDLARGQDCTVNSRECNHDPATVVSAHNPFGDRGMGTKCADHESCWACSACHDVLDGRRPGYSISQRVQLFVQGHRRTVAAWFELGLVAPAGKSSREKPRPRASKSLAHPGYSR